MPYFFSLILFQVSKLLLKLQSKLSCPDKHHYSHYKTIRTHVLPVTNVSFNKSGSKFVSGLSGQWILITDQGHLFKIFELMMTYTSNVYLFGINFTIKLLLLSFLLQIRAKLKFSWFKSLKYYVQ